MPPSMLQRTILERLRADLLSSGGARVLRNLSRSLRKLAGDAESAEGSNPLRSAAVVQGALTDVGLDVTPAELTEVCICSTLHNIF